jgi:hypothetical protein
MKIKLYGKTAVRSLVAMAIVTVSPLAVMAADTSAAGAQSKEIADLKQQIYLCHHHKRRHARVCPLPRVTEKQVFIDKPVYIDRERVVEKQVFVEKPAVIEKTEVVQTPVELLDQRVIVKHSAHRTHLLHFGIPLISVSLF